MITFFTTGKPFSGHNGVIQRNALQSWKRVCAEAEVILFGDEEGAAETARELGIRHVAEVEWSVINSGFVSTNPETRSPKVLRSFFDAAQKMARHEVMCYANCDIVLMEDFALATEVVSKYTKDFLMIGQRWDTDVREAIAFDDAGWKEGLRERALREARPQSGDWIDYFVFRKGFYAGKLPELVIGRVYWDQWLVWKAREMGAAVVDASEAVMAIHQSHDYGYHPAGKTGVWTDEYSRRNFELAGGRWHLRTIDDATHVLGPDGMSENPARRRQAVARVIRTTKEAAWSAVLDWTRPLRRALEFRNIK